MNTNSGFRAETPEEKRERKRIEKEMHLTPEERKRRREMEKQKRY